MRLSVDGMSVALVWARTFERRGRWPIDQSDSNHRYSERAELLQRERREGLVERSLIELRWLEKICAFGM